MTSIQLTFSLRSKPFRASSSRKLGREQKKGMTGEGEGSEGTVGFAGKRFLFCLPPPPSIFFCSRSNFRAITRMETLAMQAS